MITKEDARLIYNLYSQIETTEKIIEDLEKFVKSQDENIPDVIPESYSVHGSIEICIPHFKEGQFQTGSARVYNISYPAALRVLKNHIKHLKKKVKEHNDRLLKGDNYENA